MNQAQSSLLVDIYKLIAAQVIVFHHLCSYGPISNAVHEILPGLTSFLFDYGRYGVQVFLVVGGYLAAQSIPKLLLRQSYWRIVFNRYFRLVPAYLVALGVTMITATIARHWLSDDFVGHQETILQVLSHVILLQSILGYESISAGAWYVAIDIQLYAFLSFLLLSIKSFKVYLGVLVLFIFAGLFYFSQNDLYENYFIYFMGSYGLGVIAAFAAHGVNKKESLRIFLIIGIVILTISFFHFFLRSILASLVALTLILGGGQLYLNSKSLINKLIFWGARRSYGLFLIHFSVILAINTLYAAFQVDSSYLALLMLLVAWGMSLFFAHYFYSHVELKFKFQNFKYFVFEK